MVPTRPTRAALIKKAVDASDTSAAIAAAYDSTGAGVSNSGEITSPNKELS